MSTILCIAYGLQPYQIDGPAWLITDNYDIDATIPAGATRDQFRLMLQNLLTDRFRMVLHRSTRNSRIYALIAGKHGAKIQPSADNRTVSITMVDGHPRFDAKGQPLSRLVSFLSTHLGGPVVDETGLPGEYDFTLEFADDSDLFTAMESQLGLKLVEKTGPVEVIVVDSAEKIPAGNLI